MIKSNSIFKNAPDITPRLIKKEMSISELVQFMGGTSFEARKVFQGAELFKKMINDGDTIWLGIAGAGVAGGMGGMIISLLEAGFIDVICSTGAQVYHDLHFAFDLPVKAISPHWDDDLLRRHGDTRIYDIGIREKETLQAQDKFIQQFVKDNYEALSKSYLSSWEINYFLGMWTAQKAAHPERSFLVKASQVGVPVFWDSLANHSIAMNFVRTDREGFPINLSAQKDVFDSAAIAFSSGGTSFLELGGGGPKNFIQQTGPTINQILSIDFEGADRGLQISTAVEREGSLSSCTFSEAVTWGKYRSADEAKLVQIWSEYSIIFPLLTAYVLDLCPHRKHKDIISQMSNFINNLETAQ
ncbi:MAG: deoxyhypusine synthase family protein [Candidatus Marinimicrobia bacterium]|nr:deoxyhypusine synthase family protein [bacterium]MCG2714931.1 deoxyhypusine synthase family protein [Candidatus Neomarinimicrobiota bacterium]